MDSPYRALKEMRRKKENWAVIKKNSGVLERGQIPDGRIERSILPL